MSGKFAASGRRFAVCVDNDRYGSVPRAHKIYIILPDTHAQRNGDVRVVDESGEDYLFSAGRFVAIDVPAAVKTSLLKPS